MSLMLLPFLLVVGLMAYIRLAPSDPALWNAALATDLTSDATVLVGEGSARVALAAPVDALARLNAIALATPRSRLIAGSPGEGRMTWQIRSAFFGFPDYVTAQVTDGPGGPPWSGTRSGAASWPYIPWPAPSTRDRKQPF